MYSISFRRKETEAAFLNDNYCAATLSVSGCGKPVTGGALGEPGGCVFKVGNDMYFVPTQHVADEDMIYIACDAQKIVGPVDSWRSRLDLGDAAESDVENAILDHLQTSHVKSEPRQAKQGECFVVTRDGKTFRL